MNGTIHKVKLWGQLKHLTGEEFVDAYGTETIDELLVELSEKKSEIRHFLLAGNRPNPSILVFINENQHVWGSESALSENDSITIMSPIAGG